MVDLQKLKALLEESAAVEEMQKEIQEDSEARTALSDNEYFDNTMYIIQHISYFYVTIVHPEIDNILT